MDGVSKSQRNLRIQLKNEQRTWNQCIGKSFGLTMACSLSVGTVVFVLFELFHRIVKPYKYDWPHLFTLITWLKTNSNAQIMIVKRRVIASHYLWSFQVKVFKWILRSFVRLAFHESVQYTYIYSWYKTIQRRAAIRILKIKMKIYMTRDYISFFTYLWVSTRTKMKGVLNGLFLKWKFRNNLFPSESFVSFWIYI